MAPDPSLPDDWQQQVGRAYLVFGVSRLRDAEQYTEFISISGLLRGARNYWTTDKLRAKEKRQLEDPKTKRWIKQRADTDIPGLGPEPRAHVPKMDVVDELDIPESPAERQAQKMFAARKHLVSGVPQKKMKYTPKKGELIHDYERFYMRQDDGSRVPVDRVFLPVTSAEWAQIIADGHIDLDMLREDGYFPVTPFSPTRKLPKKPGALSHVIEVKLDPDDGWYVEYGDEEEEGDESSLVGPKKIPAERVIGMTEELVTGMKGTPVPRSRIAPHIAKETHEYAKKRIQQEIDKAQDAYEGGDSDAYEERVYLDGLLEDLDRSWHEYEEELALGLNPNGAAKKAVRRTELILNHTPDRPRDRFIHDAKIALVRAEPDQPRTVSAEEVQAAIDAATAVIRDAGGFGERNGLFDPDLAQEHLDAMMRAGRLAHAMAQARMAQENALAMRNGRSSALAADAPLPEGVTEETQKAHREAQEAALRINLQLLEELAGRAGAHPDLVNEAVARGQALDMEDKYPAEGSDGKYGSLTAEEAAMLAEAFTHLPAGWEDAIIAQLERMHFVSSGRAHYYDKKVGTDPLLAISRNPELHMYNQEIAVHEMLHAMERMIPGLKRAEIAYWNRRVGSDTESHPRDNGLVPDDPLFPTAQWYSLKRNRSGMFELITTGGQNIFGGGTSDYLDDGFAAFVWGMFLTLQRQK